MNLEPNQPSDILPFKSRTATPSDAADCRNSSNETGDLRMAAVVCGLLLLAVLLVFGRTAWHDFVNYDDDKYVYGNGQVRNGLTMHGIVWAFTNNAVQVWIPATWLSLMCDASVYGDHAWGYHLTNVLLHAATAVGLFLVLWRMTGRLWPSALAAALFAIHPLRAESVAWVTERKDVLSGLFFVLTLGAYVGYVRHPFSFARYAAVLFCLVIGLMAKPMLVTLPFVLLLLDYWPLGRMATGNSAENSTQSQRFAVFARLIVEKVPLFAVVAAVCVLTTLTQEKSLAQNAGLPVSWRIDNAIISYVTYLASFFWPTGLAVSYARLPIDLPVWWVWSCLLLLLSTTVVIVVYWRRCPYFLVGWLWYLGMLVPVIGLLPFSTTSVADRFTYLPQIGIGIALAWGAADLCGTRAMARWAFGIAAGLAVLCLMGAAWQQTSYWRNSETLWNRSLECCAEDDFAEGSLGMALHQAGRIDEAVKHYEAALRIRPDAAVHNNLGGIFASRGQMDAAMEHFKMAVAIMPDNADAHSNLGRIFAERGQLDNAIVQFHKALESDPNNVNIYGQLGDALRRQGKNAEAAEQWRKATELQPSALSSVYQLAWLLATCPDAAVRNGADAVELASRAVQLSRGKDPAILGVLAAAYAENKQFSEAIEAADRAVAAASAAGKTRLAEALQQQRKLYQANTPYRVP